MTISDNINRPRSHRKRHKETGHRSLAIVLVDICTYPEHECVIGNLARSFRFTYVLESAWRMPMIKMVPHDVSPTADAYLT